MRKATLLIIATLLVAALLGSGVQLSPSRAEGQPGNDFPVTLEIVGVIQTISTNQLSLVDGTLVKINKQTRGFSSALKPGITVTVTAQMDDEDLVAVSIVVGDVSSADVTATSAATPGVTAATPEKGKGKNSDNDNGPGKGKGQGKGNGQGNANDDDGSGQGKGNGKGNNNDDGQGKGNNGKGKGNGDNIGQSNGKGKNDDKQLTACLKNTKHPVVTRLAEAFGVPYLEIMTWHCQHKGFGEIARAYILARKTGMSVAQIFALRDGGKGWGEIIKNARLDPQDLAPGVVIHGKQGKGDKK